MLNLRKRHDEVVDVSVLASFDDALVGNVFFVCAEKHIFFDRASIQCGFLRHEGQMFSVLGDVEAGDLSAINVYASGERVVEAFHQSDRG